MLYAKLTKAVYGTLLGGILFYEKLKKQLEDWDFEMNPYDNCVFNKVVDGNQVTFCFFVDACKISHMDQEVIDDILTDLNNVFATKKKRVSVAKGSAHDYLGITINYGEEGKVKFTMYDFLKDIIAEAPADMNGIAVNPARDNLFETHEDTSPPLDTKTVDLFHRTTARLLFAAKRARPDIQVAIAYWCTRVKGPNKADYVKLARVIRYLRRTMHLPLVLGWDKSGTICWNVDASFAVHKDMRSHTGAVLTLGQGALLSMSRKQKINTRSSTEAELIEVDSTITFIEWVQLFVECQFEKLPRHSVLHKIGNQTALEQDNTSAIQLERNGKRSSTKRTRHINIKYFYITNKVKEEGLKIVHCPTKSMCSDYLTKSLGGNLFYTHRNTIMGINAVEESEYANAYNKAKNKANEAQGVN